jgi:endonuclease/exonuclease/phosphatase (EEP) superfamily protein YafD
MRYAVMTLSAGRVWLAGALTPPVVMLDLVAVTAVAWPSGSGLGTFGRIADSLAPQLVALALAATLVMGLIRVPRGFTLLCAALTLASAGLLAARHLERAAPVVPGAPAQLTLLWFNMLGDNATPPARLIAALAASPADVVLLAESAPLAADLEGALAAAFPVRAGCRQLRCGSMMLARGEAAARLSGLEVRTIGRPEEPRLTVAEITLPGAPPLTVIGAHLIKPWFFGFSEADEWFLYTALADRSGPLVVAGDFNAAPWSRRLDELWRLCALAPPRWPPATWPVAAGPAGVPIDNILVRGGARLVSLDTWGAELGSNHLGLLARIALPEPGAAPAPGPASCRPPQDDRG